MTEYEITNIIREAIYVHRTLGPGLLEEVYKQCLAYRLRIAGLATRTEIAVPRGLRKSEDGLLLSCRYHCGA